MEAIIVCCFQKINIEVIYMEVNLKTLQDAGARVHQVSVRQGGLSVVSTADTMKPASAVETKPSNITSPKNHKEPREAKNSENAAAAHVTLNKVELQGIATELTKFMQSLNTDIHFSVHEKSGRMMIQVVDPSTKEVLKEFPPEELLDTIGAIREYVGALLDKKV